MEPQERRMLAQPKAAEGGGCVGGGHHQLPWTGLESFPSQVVEARLDNLCVCQQQLCMVKYHPSYWCITVFITPHFGPCNSWCYRRHCSFLAPCIRVRGSKEYVRAILATYSEYGFQVYLIYLPAYKSFLIAWIGDS